MGTQIADATTTPVDDSFCDPPAILPTGYICTGYDSNMSLWLMNYTASYMSCKSFSCDLRQHYRGMVTATCNQPGDELQLSGCVPLVEIMYGLPVIAIRVLLQLALVVGVVGALVSYGIILSDTSVKGIGMRLDRGWSAWSMLWWHARVMAVLSQMPLLRELLPGVSALADSFSWTLLRIQLPWSYRFDYGLQTSLPADQLRLDEQACIRSYEYPETTTPPTTTTTTTSTSTSTSTNTTTTTTTTTTTRELSFEELLALAKRTTTTTTTTTTTIATTTPTTPTTTTTTTTHIFKNTPVPIVRMYGHLLTVVVVVIVVVVLHVLARRWTLGSLTSKRMQQVVPQSTVDKDKSEGEKSPEEAHKKPDTRLHRYCAKLVKRKFKTWLRPVCVKLPFPALEILLMQILCPGLLLSGCIVLFGHWDIENIAGLTLAFITVLLPIAFLGVVGRILQKGLRPPDQKHRVIYFDDLHGKRWVDAHDWELFKSQFGSLFIMHRDSRPDRVSARAKATAEGRSLQVAVQRVKTRLMMEKIRDGNKNTPGVATDPDNGFLMESKSNQEIVPATPEGGQDGQSLARVTPGGGLSMAALAMGLQRASKNQQVEGGEHVSPALEKAKAALMRKKLLIGALNGRLSDGDAALADRVRKIKEEEAAEAAAAEAHRREREHEKVLASMDLTKVDEWVDSKIKTREEEQRHRQARMDGEDLSVEDDKPQSCHAKANRAFPSEFFKLFEIAFLCTIAVLVAALHATHRVYGREEKGTVTRTQGGEWLNDDLEARIAPSMLNLGLSVADLVLILTIIILLMIHAGLLLVFLPRRHRLENYLLAGADLMSMLLVTSVLLAEAIHGIGSCSGMQLALESTMLTFMFIPPFVESALVWWRIMYHARDAHERQLARDNARMQIYELRQQLAQMRTKGLTSETAMIEEKIRRLRKLWGFGRYDADLLRANKEEKIDDGYDREEEAAVYGTEWRRTEQQAERLERKKKKELVAAVDGDDTVIEQSEDSMTKPSFRAWKKTRASLWVVKGADKQLKAAVDGKGLKAANELGRMDAKVVSIVKSEDVRFHGKNDVDVSKPAIKNWYLEKTKKLKDDEAQAHKEKFVGISGFARGVLATIAGPTVDEQRKEARVLSAVERLKELRKRKAELEKELEDN